MIGHAMTVLGPVAAETLGATITHEHLLVSLAHLMKPPEAASDRVFFTTPMSLDLIADIRFGGLANADNFALTDIDLAAEEAARFRAAGGRTIVDATSIGIGRDPVGLARIARVSGLNIIMGSSYYVEETHPPGRDVGGRSEADIAEEIIGDLMEGVDGTGIRSGLIGEVGCSWPLTRTEIKVLRASARAQRATGAPLMIHPGRHPSAPAEIIRILADAGADIGRTVICHLDRTIDDQSALVELARTGCMLEYDLFGYEHSYYPWSIPIDMPNDAGRVDIISFLLSEGFGDRVTISHDICFKDKLRRFGGPGYAHILRNVVPLMRRKSVPASAIEAILIDNPRRLLGFAAPAPV